MMSRINVLSAGLSLAGLVITVASTQAEILDSSPAGFEGKFEVLYFKLLIFKLNKGGN